MSPNKSGLVKMQNLDGNLHSAGGSEQECSFGAEHSSDEDGKKVTEIFSRNASSPVSREHGNRRFLNSGQEVTGEERDKCTPQYKLRDIREDKNNGLPQTCSRSMRAPEIPRDGMHQYTSHIENYLISSYNLSLSPASKSFLSGTKNAASAEDTISQNEARHMFKELRYLVLKDTMLAINMNSAFKQFPVILENMVSECVKLIEGPMAEETTDCLALDAPETGNGEEKLQYESLQHIAELRNYLQDHIERQKPMKTVVLQICEEMEAMKKWKDSVDSGLKELESLETHEQCKRIDKLSLEFDVLDEIDYQAIKEGANRETAEISLQTNFAIQDVEKQAIRVAESCFNLKGRHESFQEDLRSKLDLTSRKMSDLWTRLSAVLVNHEIPRPPNLFGKRATSLGNEGIRLPPSALFQAVPPPLPPLPPPGHV